VSAKLAKGAYVPTGRPPGRPRKPEVERQGIRDVLSMMAERTVDRATRPLRAFCPDCFPEGFPDGIRTMGCPHGTWAKR
jgi:hypothetical protein